MVQYLPIVLFEREMARSDALREVVDGYCHSSLETTLQTVACNRLHSTEQRCCRWLLSAYDRLHHMRFELKGRFLARAMGVKNSEIARILAALENHGVIRYDGKSITIVDAAGMRAIACRCYDAMKRGYTLAVQVASPSKPLPSEQQGARVLPMRSAPTACTLCGWSVRLPHRNGHDCILGLDEEISGLIDRTSALRKFTAQLVAQRTQWFRDILKRTAGGLVDRTVP